MELRCRLRSCVAAIALLLNAFCDVAGVRAEMMLQYFNTSWNEITAKMPELAEAGYDAIWIPPPTKGGGALSVGYDLFDPFDLGSKDQKGTVASRYGTEADLLRLVETAHRFGLRVYLDNVMNHRGFDVPGYSASTPIDFYPGMLPEDFHVQVTADGFYRNWPGINDYSNQFQVRNLSTSKLMDIAQEPGTVNLNFGTTEGSTHPKIEFARHPNNPEYYCDKPDGTYVGFGTTNGLTRASLEPPVQAGKDWKISPWTADWYSRADWEKAEGPNFYQHGVFERRYGGDLQGVLDKLDYLSRLGVNALYFCPLFYARSLHKYDGNSYHHIDPYFGPDPAAGSRRR